jgi:hypothetical protein
MRYDDITFGYALDRESSEEPIHITVGARVWAGEVQWFDPVTGVGHPGAGPEIELREVTDEDGEEIQLTASCRFSVLGVSHEQEHGF